jgi:hypothetical protein
MPEGHSVCLQSGHLAADGNTGREGGETTARKVGNEFMSSTKSRLRYLGEPKSY